MGQPHLAQIRSRFGLACVGASLLAGSLGAASAQAFVTKTFVYTGAEQTFTVPGGVTSVGVVAIGGHGGAASGAAGAPADVIGSISVTPGQTLYVEVGGVGQSSGEGGEGGFNGGGDGIAGGGGASDVRTSPRTLGLAPDPRLIVAAGGGGGGGEGPNGGGGAGGAAEEAGSEDSGGGGNQGGGAGTSSAGGAAGSGCGGVSTAGLLGEGGSGGSGEAGSNGGGGGGGGLYGGGGGGGGCSFGGGGGGGGSSLVPPSGLVAAASGAEPKIELKYTPVPPTIEIVSPANGATYAQGQGIAAIYSCAPAEGVGMKACAGPVANGAALDTATLGQHTFTVNAEDTTGSTASKSVIYNVVAAPSQNPPPPIPNTVLGTHPKPKVVTAKSTAKVKFTFSSDVAGTTFKCKLDKGSFVACTSPKTYKVKPGKHVFSVEAVGPGGTDPTPATFRFKVVKKT